MVLKRTGAAGVSSRSLSHPQKEKLSTNLTLQQRVLCSSASFTVSSAITNSEPLRYEPSADKTYEYRNLSIPPPIVNGSSSFKNSLQNQFCAFLAATNLQLMLQAAASHGYPWRLQGDIQDRIINDDITV